MKRHYEIALMQHVHGSVEDDYETVRYACEGCSYYECKAMAKELSKYIGQREVQNAGKFLAQETRKEEDHAGRDEGLAAVKIVCYTENDMTTYEPLYYEYYRDGKVDYKVTFDEPIL